MPKYLPALLLGNDSQAALIAYNAIAAIDSLPLVSTRLLLTTLDKKEPGDQTEAIHLLLTAAAELARKSAALTLAARKVWNEVDLSEYFNEALFSQDCELLRRLEAACEHFEYLK